MPSSTERHRFALAARIALAGVAVTGGAMLCAGTAAADPGVSDPQLPIAPVDPAAVPPGQPVAVAAPAGPDVASAPAPAPPVGPPPVPEMQNPGYGGGQSGQTFGYLRDLWHASRSGDPLSALTVDTGGSMAPPPGAGPAPKLPPGYTSLTAPESSTPGIGYPSLNAPGAPTLPPGYIPIDGGPPPPGWYDQPPADPGAPSTSVLPAPQG